MTWKAVFFPLILVLVFAITVLAERKLIPYLKGKKMGQKILEIGPRWHKSKEGTPTMGGLGFIFAFVLVFISAGIFTLIKLAPEKLPGAVITVVFALLCGLIGFIDDRAKFFKKQNEGLTAVQKFFLQLVATGIYLVLLSKFSYISTELFIPYLNVNVELGVFYYVFAFILITGVVNSVNLTDGIDGLASSVTVVVGVFFALVGFRTDDVSVLVLSALVIGACLGFLVYNFYPARVFMGDTGSLFLGALVVGAAFMINNPLIIVVAGLVYIVETVSVMLQVLVYKLTKKRLFKMSPIHHHFEMCSWSEIKIVGVFSLVSALMGIVAFFGIQY